MASEAVMNLKRALQNASLEWIGTSMTSQSCKMSLRDGGTSTCTKVPLGEASAFSAMRLSRLAICSAAKAVPAQLLI